VFRNCHLLKLTYACGFVKLTVKCSELEMSLNFGRVCRLCLADTDYMSPLFNEDAVLPTRIMVVMPVMKVYVLLVHLLCIFVRCVLCVTNETMLVGLFGNGMFTAAGNDVIVNGRCKLRRLSACKLPP